MDSPSQRVPQLFCSTKVLEPFVMFKLYKPFKLLNIQGVLIKKTQKNPKIFPVCVWSNL